MKTLRFLLVPALLLSAAGCKKEKDAEPTKTALLTAKTWRESSSTLVVNGAEGVQNTPTANASTWKFSTDNKVTVTKPNNTTSTGTWALAENDTKITLTLNGQTQTQQIFTLDANNFSAGFSFTQAQVQAAINGQSVPGVPNGLITLILLSAGGFTFPAGTPAINANQITSLQLRTNLVAQ